MSAAYLNRIFAESAKTLKWWCLWMPGSEQHKHHYVTYADGGKPHYALGGHITDETGSFDLYKTHWEMFNSVAWDGDCCSRWTFDEATKEWVNPHLLKVELETVP